MQNENYITEYSKKNETENIIYLHCKKRGNKGDLCPGKAKYEKKTRKFIIYKKYINSNNIHKTIDIDEFKKIYYNNNCKNLDMSLIIYHKFYIVCLFNENKVTNFTDCASIFKNEFKNIKFLLTENIVNKIKTEVKGNLKN